MDVRESKCPANVAEGMKCPFGTKFTIHTVHMIYGSE